MSLQIENMLAEYTRNIQRLEERIRETGNRVSFGHVCETLNFAFMYDIVCMSVKLISVEF